jgi:hypothetical protein
LEKVRYQTEKTKILKKKIFFPKIQISINNVSKYELVWSTDKKVGRRDKLWTLPKKSIIFEPKKSDENENVFFTHCVMA